MNKKYKLFVFDFDGTLGDTKECIVASFQQALIDNDLPEAKRESIIHNMGRSLPWSFRNLTENKLDEPAYEKLVSDYRKRYREFLIEKTLIFPEVQSTLQKLKESNKLISIATSKKTEFAKMSSNYLKISEYIDLYIGDDLVKNKKPHPEMLETTLRKLQIDKEDAVMIGDSTFDIDMGNTIGMDTIAVTWGSHTEEELTSSKPTYMIHQFSELLAFI